MKLFGIFKKEKETIESNGLPESSSIDETKEHSTQSIASVNNKSSISKPITSLEEAVLDLRERIIEAIAIRPDTEYEFCSVIFEDARKCFPNEGWDAASFKLDLVTRGLKVYLRTYPSLLGAYFDDTIDLSFSEFSEIALRVQALKNYRFFQTKEDWDSVFDDRLNTAVAEAREKLKE